MWVRAYRSPFPHIPQSLMRNREYIWETRRRLLMEQLEELANQLSSEEQVAETVVEDQAVRLLTAMFMSLRHHKVNKRGQCHVCSRPIRMWWFWRRRPQCTLISPWTSQ
jgi:hypothetical protein